MINIFYRWPFRNQTRYSIHFTPKTNNNVIRKHAFFAFLLNFFNKRKLFLMAIKKDVKRMQGQMKSFNDMNA